MSYVIYDPFFTRKTPISENNSFMTPFSTLFVLSRASDNTTSQNIGRTDAWAVPHLEFLGDRPPVPPRSPPMGIYKFCGYIYRGHGVPGDGHLWLEKRPDILAYTLFYRCSWYRPPLASSDRWCIRRRIQTNEIIRFNCSTLS